MRKNVTLSIDEEIYSKYRAHCEKEAVALSKSIENFMKREIDDGN